VLDAGVEAAAGTEGGRGGETVDDDDGIDHAVSVAVGHRTEMVSGSMESRGTVGLEEPSKEMLFTSPGVRGVAVTVTLVTPWSTEST
jgi:hypothetical protein